MSWLYLVITLGPHDSSSSLWRLFGRMIWPKLRWRLNQFVFIQTASLCSYWVATETQWLSERTRSQGSAMSTTVWTEWSPASPLSALIPRSSQLTVLASYSDCGKKKIKHWFQGEATGIYISSVTNSRMAYIVRLSIFFYYLMGWD